MRTRCFVLFGIFLMTPSGFPQSDVPEWAKGAVWYQIVPERFRNANTRNDPIKERVVGEHVKDWQVHPWASDWYKFQIWELERKKGFYELVSERRYGGDLVGVIEKLKYLQELGIDVIYLNPVFESPSILKYDAATFHHIDNNYGQDREGDWSLLHSQQERPERWETTQADETFFEMLEYAHDAGIRVVIEAAFSYCSREFWAFKDLIEKQQKSDYKSWFSVLNWDDPATPDTVEFEYQCWQNNKDLPVFRQDENGLVAPVKKYIFDSTRRWVDPNGDGDPADGIDGWCVTSVAGMDSKFWEEWTELVKSINPTALTVAESWGQDPDALNRAPLDVFTNYSFTRTIEQFFIDREQISVTEFDEKLSGLRGAHSDIFNQSVLNLVGNHKTDRIASRIFNSGHVGSNGANASHSFKYDPRRPQKEHRRIQKLIAIFQMTYMGAPMIYYGDESGMWGGPKPDNLKPMLWSEFVVEKETYRTIRNDIQEPSGSAFDADLFDLYRRLNKIRHENPAIQKGDFVPHLVDDEKNVYGYLRKFERNEVLVVLNNSDNRCSLEFESPWAKGTKIKDHLNDKKYQIKNTRLKLDLEKKWGAVLVKSK